MQIVKRRSRGFICVNAHPEGCRHNVEQWVAGVRGKIPAGQNAPKNVLVIGASTGYGLASRIAAAWGYGAKTLGVFFERPPEGDKVASAGHYNTVALPFDRGARWIVCREASTATHFPTKSSAPPPKRFASKWLRSTW